MYDTHFSNVAACVSSSTSLDAARCLPFPLCARVLEAVLDEDVDGVEVLEIWWAAKESSWTSSCSIGRVWDEGMDDRIQYITRTFRSRLTRFRHFLKMSCVTFSDSSINLRWL